MNFNFSLKRFNVLKIFILISLMTIKFSLALSFYSDGVIKNNKECSVSGVLINSVSKAYLPNTVVTIGDRYTLTNDEGEFVFHDLPFGMYKISAVKEGFDTYLDTITLESHQEKLNLSLVPESHDAVCVCRVYEAGTGRPVPEAWVTIGDKTGIADLKGYVRIENIPLLSENTILAGAYGFMTYERIIPLEKGVVKVDIFLKRPDSDFKALEPVNRNKTDNYNRNENRSMPGRKKNFDRALNLNEEPEKNMEYEGRKRDNFLLENVTRVSTLTGPTGLFNIPDAEVLPSKQVSLGISYMDDVEASNILGKSTSLKTYKITYGIHSDFEAGISLIQRTRNTAIGNTGSSSTVINLKYRLPKTRGPVDYALGYQRINAEDTSRDSMNSVYIAMDYDLYSHNLDSRLCANIMYSDISSGGITRLNMGIETRPVSWVKPCYLIMEAEQDSDNDFSQLNLGLRYKKNPVFDLYYKRDFSIESSSVGTALNLRF